MKKKGRSDQQLPELISTAVLIIGLIVIGIILIMIIRIQRGLLGAVLAAVAALLLFYWLREIRKGIRKEWLLEVPVKPAEWTYDLIQQGDKMTVVAEVPGPESQVKVVLEGRTLNIYGGQGFSKKIELSENVQLEDTSYHNGVLQIRMKKLVET